MSSHYKVTTAFIRSSKMSPATEEPSGIKPKLWFSKRFFIAVLLFFGAISGFSLRANLSIALVAMTSGRTVYQGNQTVYYDSEFNWDSKTKGLMLSVFSYGYLMTVFGGYFSTKFGGATIHGIAILGTSLITLLLPVCARFNFYVFLAGRFVEGILGGLSYTSSTEILSRWSPAGERSTLIAYSYSGGYIGSSLTYPFCGFLAERWGWPMIFYATGYIGIVWSIIWFTFVSNDPATDRWISEKEKLYLQQEVTSIQRKQQGNYPWKEIVTSMPVLAVCVAKFTYGCGHTLLLTCFPLYVKDLTNMSVDSVGILSGIPNFISIFIIPVAGHVIDYIQNKSRWSNTQIHKFILCGNTFLGAAFFTATAFIQNFTFAMIIFIIARTFLSFNFLVLQLVPICMAPYHSGTIAGFSGAWYTVCAIITPILFGFLVQNHRPSEWSTCFILTGIVSAVGGVWFMLFGSSKIQPWAVSAEDQIIPHKSEALVEDNVDESD